MRGRSLALAGLLLAASVPLVVFASPADALSAGCPTGLLPGPVSALGSATCYDGAGNYRGFVGSGGQLVAGSAEGVPTQIDVPSSVVAAGEPAGATAAQGAGLAELDAAAADGSVVLAEASAAEAAQGVPGLNIAIDGIILGTTIDKTACSLGAGWFCAPKKLTVSTGGFVPNADVVPTNPGWANANFPWSAKAANGQIINNWRPAINNNCWSNYLGAGVLTSNTGCTTFNASDPTTNALYQVFSQTQAVWNMPEVSLEMFCKNTSTGAMVDAGSVSSPGADAFQNVQAGSFTVGFTHQSGSFTNYNTYTCPAGTGLDHLVLSSYATAYANQGTADTSRTSAVWYPVGSPSRPAAAAGNPARDVITTNTCTPAGGGAAQLVTGTSPSFTETQDFPAYPNPGPCPSGTTLTKTLIVEHTLDGSLPDKTLWQQTAPAAVTTWQGNYPQCVNGQCRLGLYKVGTNGQLTSCFTAQPTDLCDGWFQDANKTSDYECTYGVNNNSSDAQVALSECTVYAPAFSPSQAGQGTTLGDPVTGATGTGQPSTAPSPSGTTVGSTAGAAGAALPGQDGASCYPSGWAAFNPLEWVYKPVVCALVAVFVPDSANLQSFVTTVQTAYNGTSIAQWANAVGAVGAGLAVPSTGCGGLSLSIPNLGPLQTAGSYDVFDTCNEPFKTVSNVVYSFAMIAIIWFTCIAVFRIVASSFGLEVPGRGN